jgi:hypothetical protein
MSKESTKLPGYAPYPKIDSGNTIVGGKSKGSKKK